MKVIKQKKKIKVNKEALETKTLRIAINIIDSTISKIQESKIKKDRKRTYQKL